MIKHVLENTKKRSFSEDDSEDEVDGNLPIPTLSQVIHLSDLRIRIESI